MFEKIAEKSSKRLDTWLAAQIPEHSRAHWQTLIKEGRVTVNATSVKRNHTIQTGDRIAWTIPEPVDAKPKPENIPLHILHEDRSIIVINKPAGLVVHPAAGNETNTLVNALLYHCADLAGIGGEKRPGIIHRLDKDTSGVIVVAKNETAMTALSRQFKNRETEKEYIAIVHGIPFPLRETIRATIGRHPFHRKMMAANVRSGRHATSHYTVEECFENAAKLRIRIETGRTHQIRVHLAHIRHPVIGDTTYGRGIHINAPRQMLHAVKLSIIHPESKRRIIFQAPLPDDIHSLLSILRASHRPQF